MNILGIETSCDETAIALIEARGEFGKDFTFRTHGSAVLSQAYIHEKYGGVFPNVAKREHARNLVPILGEVFRQAGLLEIVPPVQEIEIKKLESILEREPDLYTYLSSFLRSVGKPDIDAIAVTIGPGLEPALWVGINFAKSLATVWDVPVVPVNHMEGHIILSALLSGENEVGNKKQEKNCGFPLLSLLISGGHTELVLSKEWMHYELLGQTRDDAVGEAFDKVARLMGLKYPGGPEISRLAESARTEGITSSVRLPRPMIDSDNYDFSFSGLKTAVRREVDSHQPLTDAFRTELALEFENAAADVLVAKLTRAMEEYAVETVLVGGGVSANTHIRNVLSSRLQATDSRLLIPPPHLATDNALMIALSGYFRAQTGAYAEQTHLTAQGNLRLSL